MKSPTVARFRREHGTWPMSGYDYRKYTRRIERHMPFRHINSCWSVLDPKRDCDCGAKQRAGRRGA